MPSEIKNRWIKSNKDPLRESAKGIAKPEMSGVDSNRFIFLSVAKPRQGSAVSGIWHH
jgi:hypothetical protein